MYTRVYRSKIEKGDHDDGGHGRQGREGEEGGTGASWVGTCTVEAVNSSPNIPQRIVESYPISKIRECGG